jgi:hypothetical protein
MAYTEKNFQTLFTYFMQKNRRLFLGKSYAFELKVEKGKSFAFSKVPVHQIIALRKAKHNKYGGVYHKISDSPIFAGQKTRFTRKKPFDCLLISNTGAYLVIHFYELRKPKIMIWVDIDVFRKLKREFKAQGRKSAKQEELFIIAKYAFPFKGKPAQKRRAKNETHDN